MQLRGDEMDSDIGRKLLLNQFHTTSFGIGTDNPGCSYIIPTAKVGQNNRNDFTLQQEPICFNKQTRGAVIFQLSFIKAVFIGKCKVSNIRLPWFFSFI